MIILDTTARSLQILLSGAKTTNDCPFVSSWVDITSSTSAYLPSALPSNTNGVTAVTIGSAPASGHTIQMKSFLVKNADTVASTFTIRYVYSGPTNADVITVALQVNESLIYEDANGWYVLDSTGAIKTSVASTPGRLLRTVIGSGTTYIPGTGCNNILVKLQGGGGGGGGANTAAVSAAAGGGGAAGGYLEKYVSIVPGTTYTIAIGAAGNGGIAAGGTGSNGGQTTITIAGTTYTTNGGVGGTGASGGTTINAVAGGAPPAVSTNGDVNASGAPGAPGFTLTGLLASSGAGGSCLWGASGAGRTTQGTGNAGAGKGAGGAGACCLNGGSAVAGANGLIGQIVIEEYS